MVPCTCSASVWELCEAIESKRRGSAPSSTRCGARQRIKTQGNVLNDELPRRRACPNSMRSRRWLASKARASRMEERDQERRTRGFIVIRWRMGKEIPKKAGLGSSRWESRSGATPGWRRKDRGCRWLGGPSWQRLTARGRFVSQGREGEAARWAGPGCWADCASWPTGRGRGGRVGRGGGEEGGAGWAKLRERGKGFCLFILFIFLSFIP